MRAFTEGWKKPTAQGRHATGGAAAVKKFPGRQGFGDGVFDGEPVSVAVEEGAGERDAAGVGVGGADAAGVGVAAGEAFAVRVGGEEGGASGVFVRLPEEKGLPLTLP